MNYKMLILNETSWLLANVRRIQEAENDAQLEAISKTAKEHLNRIIELKIQEIKGNEQSRTNR